ncbi:hypothetical protein JW968_06070 [Candidatus Woesearchaeota archaeon]|nr:hypothetical protein [Candidatus Woesearchaeota archaeon]
MKKRYILIPLILIALAVLIWFFLRPAPQADEPVPEAKDPGDFIVDIKTESTVLSSLLYTDQYDPSQKYPVQTITLNNTLEETRYYEFNEPIFCIKDTEDTMNPEPVNSLYSVTIPGQDEEMIKPGSEIIKNIEVPSRTVKQIRIYYQPKALFNTADKSRYSGFEELWMVPIESEEMRSKWCFNLMDKLENSYIMKIE